MQNIPPPFEQLVGEELSAVTFVRDYIQLQFNPPPMLNITSAMILDSAAARISHKEKAFPNALIAQIGKSVKNLAFSPGDHLTIVFSDDSKLSISLKTADSAGGESIMITGKGDHWSVL